MLVDRTHPLRCEISRRDAAVWTCGLRFGALRNVPVACESNNRHRL